MSRIGKKPIPVPVGTDVSVDADGLRVKGKGGELRRPLHPAIAIKVENGMVIVEPQGRSRLAGALWGTYASHVRNMIQGVNQPFVKKLQVEGIGFKAELSGKTLSLSVGFSHPIKISVPEGLAIAVEKNIITISGADKEQVGQFAA